MHFPETVLLAGAVIRFGSLECLFVYVYEREVSGYLLDLTVFDVLSVDFEKCLTDVFSAIASLIVGKFDQRQSASGLPLKGAATLTCLPFDGSFLGPCFEQQGLA